MRAFAALAAFASLAHGDYCAAGPSSAQDSNLGEVILQGDTLKIDNTVNCPGQTGTQDFTDEIADLSPGKEYTLQYHVTTCGGPYNRASAAWIDWNGNTVFEDDEQLGEVQYTTDTPDEIKSITFTVPSNFAGNTRMRVMVQESSATVLNPCSVFAYGGVKDFGIMGQSAPTTAPPSPTTGLLMLYSDGACQENPIKIQGSVDGARHPWTAHALDFYIPTGLSTAEWYIYPGDTVSLLIATPATAFTLGLVGANGQLAWKTHMQNTTAGKCSDWRTFSDTIISSPAPMYLNYTTFLMVNV